MSVRFRLSRFLTHSTAGGIAFALLPAAALALDLQVIALTEGKAVVVIDGGKRQTLTLGRSISASSPSREFATVTLSADGRGHFFIPAHLNGAPIKVLVDTGASLVVLSSQDAKRLGISYLNGERGYANTANGVAPFYRVSLHTVKVGDITLNQVEAGVMEGSSPHIPLLGMSFLNRVEMRREGSTMTLRQRY